MRLRIPSLIAIVLLWTSFALGAATSATPDQKLRNELVEFFRKTTPVVRQLNDEISHGHSIDDKDPRKLEIRNAAKQIHHLTLSYLNASKTKFTEIKVDEDDLTSFLISSERDGSWLNNTAFQMKEHGSNLVIRPNLIRYGLLGHHGGLFEITIGAPPFSEILGSILAHELYHYIIGTSKLPHFQKGQLNSAFSKEGIHYDNFDLSEFGAFADTLSRDGEIAVRELQSGQTPFSPLTRHYDRLIYFAESHQDFLDSVVKLRNGNNSRLFRFTLMRNEGESFYNLMTEFDEDGLALHGHILFDFEGRFLPPPRKPLEPQKQDSPRPKMWYGEDLPDEVVHILFTRLEALRSLNGEFLASLRSIDRNDLENPTAIARVAGLPKKKLLELNQKWLNVLGFSSSHPSRRLDLQAEELLSCSFRECPPPKNDCIGALK